ncbi:MAG: type II secretion system F family protein [Actinomycetota bacterium]
MRDDGVDPAGVLGGGAVLLVSAALAARRDRAVTRIVEAWAGEPESDAHPRVPSVLGAIGRTRVARWAARGDRLRRSLTLAGAPWSQSEVGALKVVAALGGASVGWLVFGGSPLAAVGCGTAAFFVPDLMTARRAGRRQRGIELRVPDLVEILVATAEAGLAPAVALTRAPAVLHGPLAEEIETVSREIELGVPWRTALLHLVERTDVPSLRRMVAALTRSSRLGSSVRATLRSVAEDLRSARRVRAEELARRAPVKMLFPLVFLILPAFLLLTVGPAVLATIRSLQSGG